MIYDMSASESVQNTADRLCSQHIAEKTQLPVSESDSGIRTEYFDGAEEVVHDSAVIFVSDAMLYAPDFDAMIRELPEDTRLIPVGYPRQIAMSQVPLRLADINFIIPNEHLFENIQDSLLTDPHFYTVKNQLMLKCSQWNQSGSDAHLLADSRVIEQYRQLIYTRNSRETDPYLKKQLREILVYLDASMEYSRRIRRSAILRWSFRILLTAVSIAVLIRLFPQINRAEKRNTSSLTGDSVYADVYNAVLDTEVITNQYNSDDHRYAGHLKIAATLNQTWPYTPIAYTEMKQIRAFCAPGGTQYVWTADDSGMVCIWDTATGEKTAKYKADQNALCTLAVSDSQETAAALNEAGEIRIFHHDSWQKTGLTAAADPLRAQIQCTDSGFIIYDAKTIEIYAFENDTAVLKDTKTSEQILQAEWTDDRLYYVSSENGRMTVSSGSQAASTDFRAEDILLCSLFGGDVYICLKNGQVYSVREGTTAMIPLHLEDPSALIPVSDTVLLYHDRQLGTHFYDVRDQYDYGQFFSRTEQFTDIQAGRDLVLFRTEEMIIPYALADILPAENTQTAEITEVFDSSSSRCAEGKVFGAKITDHGLIVLESELAESGSILMDPAGYIQNNAGYIVNAYYEGTPELYSIYEGKTFYQTDGVPSVIGVRFCAANELNDHDYTYILIGMDNGTFAEFGINNTNAGICLTSWAEIPSRSAVTSISVSADRYLLQDETGSTWSVRSGFNTVTVSGIYSAMKDKLHCALPEEIIKELSRATIEGLDPQTWRSGKGWK